MGAIKKTLGDMPAIAISLTITFAILMIAGLFMYKTYDVSDDIITNTTHLAEVADRAEDFNTTGDSVVTVITTVVTLIIVFVLFAIIFYLIKSLKKGEKGGSDMV